MPLGRIILTYKVRRILRGNRRYLEKIIACMDNHSRKGKAVSSYRTSKGRMSIITEKNMMHTEVKMQGEY